MYKNI